MCKYFRFLSILMIFTIIAALSVSVEAAKKTVAIMPIESSLDDTAKQVANIMETQLTRAIHDSNSYTIVERSRLNHAMKEIGFQMTGAVDLINPSKSARCLVLSIQLSARWLQQILPIIKIRLFLAR